MSIDQIQQDLKNAQLARNRAVSQRQAELMKQGLSPERAFEQANSQESSSEQNISCSNRNRRSAQARLPILLLRSIYQQVLESGACLP